MAEGLHGVMLVGAEIKSWPRWSFRNQSDDDFGIDCQAEPPGFDYASGRLVGLQVKTGRAKYFKSKAKDGSGWYYGPDTRAGKPDKHLRYWLEHDLNVAVVLVDEVTREMFWQHVTLDRIIFTGASWKIFVPASQRLDASAQEPFLDLALRQRAADHDVLGTATRHLPPSTTRLLRSLQTVDHFKALQLAVTLTRGRHNPAATIEELLHGDRKYVRGKGDEGRLSAALGAYAAEHGCHAQAAQAFADAASQTPQPDKYLTAAAQTLLTAGQRQAARSTLASAQGAGAPPLLCSWMRLFIDHEGFGHPRVPAQLAEHSARAVDAEPVLRTYLGDAALAAGELDTAAEHFQAALEAEPDNSGLQIALAQVLLTRAGSDRSLRPTADLNRSIELFSSARAQRLEWAGPSEEPLAALVLVHMLAGDFQEAVRLATPRPEGEATVRERASGLVPYVGVKAALDLGDRAAAARIADGIGVDSQFTSAIRLLLAETMPSPDRQRQWQRIIDTTQDLDLLASAVHRIADTGQWPIPQLDELHAAGVITSDGYETIRARSEAARGDLAAARRRLRAVSVPIAVQTHVELLEAAGQFDEALTVCTRGLAQFKTVHLAAKQWNLLVRLDRAQEAEQRAVALLGQAAVPLMVRERLRSFIIDAALQRYDWLTVEEQCQAALQENPDQPKFKWALIGVAYNQRQWTNAWARLREMDPPILTPSQASLWLGLHSYFEFSEDEALAALAFIDRWPDDYALHHQVIASLSTRGNKVNAEGRPILPVESQAVGERFQAALHRFLAQGGQGLHALSGSVEEMLDSTGTRLLAQAPVDLLAREMVRQSVVPLAFVCAAQRRSYAACLLERSFGPLIAVTSDPAEFDREITDAAGALDGAVVIETSALAVAAELPGRWQLLRGAFADSFVDDATRFGCLVACSEVRQAPGTVSSLSLDIQRRQLRYTQSTDDDLATLTARANRMEDFLNGLDTHDTSEPGPSTETQPWERPIRTALARDAALWCDDVALRTHARSLGCPTFGTVALLHALAAAGQLDGDLRHEVAQLVRAEVVDLLLERDELVQIAAGFKGYPGPAAATLQRPAFWRHYEVAIEEFLAVLNQLDAPSAEALAMWVAAACGGISPYLTTQHLGPGLRAFAQTVTDHVTGTDEDRALLLKVADHVAAVEQTHRETLIQGRATLLALHPADAQTPVTNDEADRAADDTQS